MRFDENLECFQCEKVKKEVLVLDDESALCYECLILYLDGKMIYKREAVDWDGDDDDE